MKCFRYVLLQKRLLIVLGCLSVPQLDNFCILSLPRLNKYVNAISLAMDKTIKYTDIYIYILMISDG